MTNAEKFQEVFGFNPYKFCLIPSSLCPIPLKTDRILEESFGEACKECTYNDWWDWKYKSYKENEEK